MPFYEYLCNGCGEYANLFFRSFSKVTDPACPSCGSEDMKRLLSRSAIVRTDAQRAADIDTNMMLSNLDKRDKSSVVRWAKEIGSQMDGHLDTNFREMAERVESGEEHYGLTIDGDYTFQHKVWEAQQKAKGNQVEESDPFRKSPTALPPVKKGLSEV
jgi:putative FmdB family regulatory protein